MRYSHHGRKVKTSIVLTAQFKIENNFISSQSLEEIKNSIAISCEKFRAGGQI